MNLEIQATIYLLKYWGQRATTKQVEKYLSKAVNRLTVVRMATERGFKGVQS